MHWLQQLLIFYFLERRRLLRLAGYHYRVISIRGIIALAFQVTPLTLLFIDIVLFIFE